MSFVDQSTGTRRSLRQGGQDPPVVPTNDTNNANDTNDANDANGNNTEGSTNNTNSTSNNSSTPITANIQQSAQQRSTESTQATTNNEIEVESVHSNDDTDPDLSYDTGGTIEDNFDIEQALQERVEEEQERERREIEEAQKEITPASSDSVAAPQAPMTAQQGKNPTLMDKQYRLMFDNVNDSLRELEKRLHYSNEANTSNLEAIRSDMDSSRRELEALPSGIIKLINDNMAEAVAIALQDHKEQEKRKRRLRPETPELSSRKDENSEDEDSMSMDTKQSSTQHSNSDTEQHQNQGTPSTIVNAYQTPAQTTRTKTFSIPPSTVTTAASTAGTVFVEKKEVRPLVFKHFKDDSGPHGYMLWKSMCFLEIACHSEYNAATYKDLQNKIQLMPSMSSTHSQAIFLATTKALSPNVVERVITADLTLQADAVKLWSSLDKSILKLKAGNFLLHEKMTKELNSISRHPNESFEQYALRYNKQLELCKMNGVPNLPTDGTLAFKLIKGLGYPTVFKEVLKKVLRKPKWYQSPTGVPLTCTQIIELAQDHFDEEKEVLGKSFDVIHGKNSEKKKEQVQDLHKKVIKPPKDEYKKPGGKIKDKNTQDQYNGPDFSYINKFREILKSSNNKIGELYETNRQHHKSCPFHPNGSHPFIQCYTTARVCREANCIESLKQVHQTLDITPPSNSYYGQNDNATDSPNTQSILRNGGANNNNNNTLSYRSGNNNNQQSTARMAKYVQSQVEKQLSQRLKEAQKQWMRDFKAQQQSFYDDIEDEDDDENDEDEQNNDNETTFDYSPSSHSLSSLCSQNETSIPSNPLFCINEDSDLVNNTVHNKRVTFDPSVKTIPNNIIARVSVQSSYRKVNNKETDKYTAVIDSGATDHISPFANVFESITYINSSKDTTPHILMGDETTAIPVVGYGMMNYMLNGLRVRCMGLYAPRLGNTILLSVKKYMSYKGCYFHAEANNTMLAFPDGIIFPSIDDEITVQVKPATRSKKPYIFDEDCATEVDIKTPSDHIHSIARKSTSTKTITFQSPGLDKYIPNSSDRAKFQHKVLIKRIVPHAKIPSRGTLGAIGYDVASTTEVILQPGVVTPVPTGLATAFQPDIYLRIAPRSGLAMKGIDVKAGVVDSDYRGEIKVLLYNNTHKLIRLELGQNIAQFIFEKASLPCIEVVSTLPKSKRNEGGFGSTDNKAQRRIQVFRPNAKEIYIVDRTNTKRTVRRVQRPLTNSIAHPNDHRYHNSPHRAEIDKNEDTRLYRKAANSKELQSLNHTVEIDKDLQTEIPPTPQKPVQPEDFYKRDNIIDIQQLSDNKSTPVDEVLRMHADPINSTTSNERTEKQSPSVPSRLPVDSVNKALPRISVVSRDRLQQSIGFLKPDKLIKHIHKLGKDTIQIQKEPPFEHEIDPGETASMNNTRRNTTPSESPEKYSDIWHWDIGFGPCTAIGGIKYTLLMVDKFSRRKMVYGLKNLTSSLHTAVQQFLVDVGEKPKLIRTDFDKKLIGGKVKKLLTEKGIAIEAAPPYRQHQNGLVERHWQTAVAMTRNWLTSSQLPTKYWYFGIKRACEVANLMPLTKDGKLTTPYELVYNEKPDYRLLFPMFATAYIRQQREDGQDKSKWTSRSLRCISVGKCHKSDGLLFYHPESKQLFTCANGYKFDITSPAGPKCGEVYDGKFIFNTKGSQERIHRPPTHEENATVYFKQNEQYVKARVLSVPFDDDNEHYVIQEIDNGNIHEMKAEDILEADPTININDIDNTKEPFYHIPWIKNKAKATMILPTLNNKPKRGYLHTGADNEWYFSPGRKIDTNPPIKLQNFPELAQSMIENKKLFPGWISTAAALTVRRVRATSNLLAGLILARKVSAKDLHVMEAPTSLLKHAAMHPEDKATWDESYRQEYQGLVDIDTWDTISEEEYNLMRDKYKGTMPTMAIAVIKYDGDGKPVRAKYRIVALGNLDPNNWSKNDCFAPVMSQFELRFLVALAAKNKCIPKSGDITQAFCQSYLPEGENYICRPPVGCPLTPKGTFWKLRKTLYGLKRSPRHFYELAKKKLEQVGLKQHPNSHCIFSGTLIKGHPPIYLGIYVDDIIYFSASREVEKKFEKDFGDAIDTDFNGPIGYYLGINFKHHRDKDGNVTILMTQEAFIENLCDIFNISPTTLEPKTPYRSGFPVDSIPPPLPTDTDTQKQRTLQMQQIIGSINWLAVSTRPDISTICNMCARYMANPSKAHIAAAKRIIKYLKGTKTKGIAFTTKPRSNITSYLKFPLPPNTVTSLCDANWGPQDQSTPKKGQSLKELDLFKTRSVSGFVIWLNGPIHWVSKRQAITARSSAEAEIYATDECLKWLLHLSHIVEGLGLKEELMPEPNIIYNDNKACVFWSKAMTTKGLRHIQIRENAIRESVQSGFLDVQHVNGKVNLADMFTKEDKNAEHFMEIRDMVLTDSNDFKKQVQSKCFRIFRGSPLFPLFPPEGGVGLGVPKRFRAQSSLR